MVWGIFPWHTLVPLVPIEHRLNATSYLSIVADHVHPFMTIVYPSSDGYFQQHNAPCHKAQIISDWFLEHDNEFTLLKWPPHSPDLNPIEHLWDVVEREIHIMDVQPTNLQQLRDAIMTIWTKSQRNVSNTLLNLCHEELRKFWRQKRVQPGTSKVYDLMGLLAAFWGPVLISLLVCLHPYLMSPSLPLWFPPPLKNLSLSLCLRTVNPLAWMTIVQLPSHWQSWRFLRDF